MIRPKMLMMLPLFVVWSCAPGTNEIPPIHRKMFSLVENFDRYDVDGDGYLTRQELENGVDSMGPDRLTKNQYDRVMLVYDTNRDKKVSLTETKVAAANGPVVFEN